MRILRKIVEAILWIGDNEFKNVTLDGESIGFVKEVVDGKEVGLEGYVCKVVDQELVQGSCYKSLL